MSEKLKAPVPLSGDPVGKSPDAVTIMNGIKPRSFWETDEGFDYLARACDFFENGNKEVTLKTEYGGRKGKVVRFDKPISEGSNFSNANANVEVLLDGDKHPTPCT